MKKHMNILIADDDENTCQLLEEYITVMGHKVDIAYDGKRAMEYLGSKAYGFVFLDCNMPEITGLELTKYLTKEKPRPKIIMMTGYGPIDENFAKAAGVDVYLSKPFLLDDVRKVLTHGK